MAGNNASNTDTSGITLQGSAAMIRTATIMVTSLFFLWGIMNNSLPAIIAKVKEACDINMFQASLIASAFWVAYFVMPIPASIVMRRFGYRGAIVVGLGLATLGCALFALAGSMISYKIFLLAPFVSASGMAFLESASNPYISVLGDAESAPKRLNFAQTFNGVAAFVASLWGTKMILSDVPHAETALKSLNPNYYAALDANAAALGAKKAVVFSDQALFELKHAIPQFVEALNQNARSAVPLFVGAAIVFFVALVVFLIVKIPDTHEHQSGQSEVAEEKQVLSQLFGQKYFLFGVLALFCYVGAQCGVDDFFLLYVPKVTGLSAASAPTYLGLALGFFMLGRIVGTSLLTKIAARKLLFFFALVNVLLLIYVGVAPHYVAEQKEISVPSWLNFAGDKIVLISHPAIYVLLAVKFFMSIMFPTIFSLAITNLGNLTKTASMILVMSIVGGAVFTPLMGYAADLFHNVGFAYLLPMVGTVVVAAFAMMKPPMAEKQNRA